MRWLFLQKEIKAKALSLPSTALTATIKAKMQV
jgi:hypothetical protein